MYKLPWCSFLLPILVLSALPVPSVAQECNGYCIFLNWYQCHELLFDDPCHGWTENEEWGVHYWDFTHAHFNPGYWPFDLGHDSCEDVHNEWCEMSGEELIALAWAHARIQSAVLEGDVERVSALLGTIGNLEVRLDLARVELGVYSRCHSDPGAEPLDRFSVDPKDTYAWSQVSTPKPGRETEVGKRR